MKKAFALILVAALLSPAVVLANGVIPVPEPGTLALLAMGIAGLALSRRRKTD